MGVAAQQKIGLNAVQIDFFHVRIAENPFLGVAGRGVTDGKRLADGGIYIFGDRQRTQKIAVSVGQVVVGVEEGTAAGGICPAVARPVMQHIVLSVATDHMGGILLHEAV